MKKYGILLLLLAGITFAFGQQKESGVVKIRGTRLAYPLINKWIEEFKKVYPNIQVSIASSAPADSIDLSIAAYALTDKELTETRGGVAFTRYVQLPVANSKRPDLAPLQARGFSEADFRKNCTSLPKRRHSLRHHKTLRPLRSTHAKSQPVPRKLLPHISTTTPKPFKAWV